MEIHHRVGCMFWQGSTVGNIETPDNCVDSLNATSAAANHVMSFLDHETSGMHDRRRHGGY